MYRPEPPVSRQLVSQPMYRQVTAQGGGYGLPRKELAIRNDVSLHFFLTIYKRNVIYQSNKKVFL